MKYKGIPISELRKVLNQITPDNFTFPSTEENALTYRRIWVFRINGNLILEFNYDVDSHKQMLKRLEQFDVKPGTKLPKENFQIVGEIELHWNRSQNDWIIKTLIL